MHANANTLQTMKDLVDRNAALHSDDLHHAFGDRRLTFEQFGAICYELAGALYELGLRQQDRYALLAMNCPEYLEICGAAEVSKFVVAPVNFRLAPPEIEWILNDVAPKVLFFEEQYLDVVDGLRDKLPGIRHYVVLGDKAPEWATTYRELLSGNSRYGTPYDPEASDILTLIYTSGTTGRPKGVMLPHSAMLALGEAWAFELEADIGNKMLLPMPLFHIGARSQGAALTFRGGSLVVQRSFDARAVVDAVAEEGITQLHLAPTLLQAVLDLPDLDNYDFSRIKTINYAAAPMPLATLKRAMARFGPILINGYGQTEGSGLTLRKHYHRPNGNNRDLHRLTSVGQPVHRTEVCILNEREEEVPRETVGEICIRSAQVMAGYWNNSVASIETLRGGWLHTGDLGYMDEDGFVYLVDRKKDMIISGGENVYSREVEEALMSHDSVNDVAVIGIADEKWGEMVTAVVVLKAGATTTSDELIEHCRGQIAGYKCPKRIEFIDEIPHLPSGKTNKVQLREQFSEAN